MLQLQGSTEAKTARESCFQRRGDARCRAAVVGLRELAQWQNSAGSVNVVLGMREGEKMGAHAVLGEDDGVERFGQLVTERFHLLGRNNTDVEGHPLADLQTTPPCPSRVQTHSRSPPFVQLGRPACEPQRLTAA
jgi:hypothetical protein